MGASPLHLIIITAIHSKTVGLATAICKSFLHANTATGLAPPFKNTGYAHLQSAIAL